MKHANLKKKKTNSQFSQREINTSTYIHTFIISYMQTKVIIYHFIEQTQLFFLKGPDLEKKLYRKKMHVIGNIPFYQKSYWAASAPITDLFNSFPNKPLFLHVCSTCLLTTLWEKEKLLLMQNISFFRKVFSPFGQLSAIFFKFKIVFCKFFVSKSLKFVVWERVNA